MLDSITIHVPKLVERGKNTRLATRLTFEDRSEEMWYELPKEYVNWFSTDRSDGFVVGFLLQAMQLRKDIVTLTPMSSKLWHNLTHFFIPMMAKAFPNLEAIQITPSSLIETVTPASGVATGFSGGVDSFAAVVDHFVNEESSSHRISHFLFHNVGSHGDKDYEAARTLFRQRYDELKAYPELVNVPFVPVDTNIHEIVPIEFVKAHSTLCASVLLVLQNQFRYYFYASTFKYEDCGVNVTDLAGRFDPMAFHMHSTETLDCVSSGGQMSRVEKTGHVAGYDLSRRFLNVCIDPNSEGRNCSTCLKCCRTLLTLDLLGLSERYSKAFDLGRFKKVRKRYIKEKVLRASKGGFEYEIVELARESCKEPWANQLRRKRTRKEVCQSAKTGITGFPGKIWTGFKRKVKGVAPSASVTLRKFARRLIGR